MSFPKQAVGTVMKAQLKNGHVHMGEAVSEDEPFKLRSRERRGARWLGCVQIRSSSWCLLNKHITVSLTALAGQF